MKKFFILIGLLGCSSLVFSACASLKPTASTKETREQLLAKESWRYNLPEADLTPVRPNFPHVAKAILKNGLTVLVVQDHRLPIAEVGLAFRNGSALDPIGKAGLQNMTALMLKEGTAKLTSLELAEAFANLGTEVSVGAGKDMAFISTGVLSPKIGEAMALVAAMAQAPRLASEDFARVKLLQENTVRSEMATPQVLAQVRFLMAAYGEKHPYAYPSYGTVQTVDNISLADVKRAYHNHFGPNNAALVVVGDVTLDQVLKMAKREFGHWKKIKDPVHTLPRPHKHNHMQTLLVARPGMPQTFLLLGQPVASQLDKDLATYEVFQNILAGMPTSRLGTNLRERKGWTYGVGSSLVPYRGIGPLFISTSVQVPYGADALKEILGEFENMKNHPVTEEELKAAKNGLLHSFASRYSTVKKIASGIWENYVYDLAMNRDEVFYDEIARVTPKDIMRVANKALKREDMTAVAVGELEVMEIPIAKMDVGTVIIERN